MKIKMNTRYLAALFVAGSLGISPVHAASHSHTPAPAEQADALSTENEATPKLILSEPRADVLKDGYVYLPFRVENMTILPLYTEIHGEEATKLKPKIGHLHVMVDDNKWNWIHALTDAIYFGPLSPGAHKVRLELVDAAHSVIEVQTIEVVVP